MKVAILIAAFALTGISLAAADKPKGAPLVKLPRKTIEIKDLEVAHPKQPCPNWSWAAALETMLLRQQIDLDQRYWVMKAYPGELCIETPIDLEFIQRLVKGDYVMLDGRKVHIEGVVTRGAPTDVGNLIIHVRDGQPLMMLWQGRPVLLQALDYDEYVYPNSQKMYEATKLTLVDPLSGKTIVFEKGTDNMSDLGGVFELQITPAGIR